MMEMNYLSMLKAARVINLKSKIYKVQYSICKTVEGKCCRAHSTNNCDESLLNI